MAALVFSPLPDIAPPGRDSIDGSYHFPGEHGTGPILARDKATTLVERCKHERQIWVQIRVVDPP